MIDKSKVKHVDITDFVAMKLFAVITKLKENLYCLEALNESEIDLASDEGFELFFNVLPEERAEDHYNEIALEAIKQGGSIDGIHCSNGSIVVMFSSPEKVYSVIDEVCKIDY